MPSTEWLASPAGCAATQADAPVPANWRLMGGTVTHTFTHFHLELKIYLAQKMGDGIPQGCAWYPRAVLDEEALPSIMRKVLAHALADDDADQPADGQFPALF